MDTNLAQLIGRFGADVLTLDGKILAYLSEHGPSRVKEVLVDVGGSYRGFYLALERLKRAGHVKAKVDAADKRARILELTLPEGTG